MSQKILIDGSDENQTQFALLSNNELEDFEFESNTKKNIRKNIYLGKVSRIEASLQAAFVDIGSEKNGFLAFAEIHPNYFQIPVADREALLLSEAEIEKEHQLDQKNNDFEKNDELVNSDDKEENIEENHESLNDEGDDDKLNYKNNSNFRNNARAKSNLRKRLLRSYRIQEVIKAGQLILVQVDKEERGNKGAALTSYISLAGKYSVLMPNSTKTKGISRKISLSDDRSKLKKIIDDLNIPPEMGLIIRTAGLNKTKNEIKKDYTILNKLWAEIVSETKKAIAPALIHEESNLLRRVVRDVYSKDMNEILVQGKEAYQETKKYMSQVLPSCSKFVKQYKNKEPLFSKHKVEKEIIKMFEPEVKLKSGGSIVINPTEALVAIDVNSGGATKERNIEKTALKTNLEASDEIVKQIKIRDLSGLIVIDFIDMYEIRNNRQVERRMKDLIKKDRARTQISRISQFGLLEMSRQRLRQSFIEWKTELSLNSTALAIIYKLKDYLNHNKPRVIGIEINPFMLDYILNNYDKEINNIENFYKVKIKLSPNQTLENLEIKIKKSIAKSSKENIKKTKPVKKKSSNKKKLVTSKKKVSTIKKTSAKDEKSTSLKEIKNKKTGWWQK